MAVPQTKFDTIKDKLISRKFWIVLASGTLVLFGEQLGWDIDADTIQNLVWVLLAYLGAQGAVDAVGAYKNGK